MTRTIDTGERAEAHTTPKLAEQLATVDLVGALILTRSSTNSRRRHTGEIGECFIIRACNTFIYISQIHYFSFADDNRGHYAIISRRTSAALFTRVLVLFNATSVTRKANSQGWRFILTPKLRQIGSIIIITIPLSRLRILARSTARPPTLSRRAGWMIDIAGRSLVAMPLVEFLDDYLF
jgi:hypothetical protein